MRIKVRHIIILVFVLVSILILGNINGLLIMLYGVSAPISPLILILCTFGSLLLIQKSKKKNHVLFHIWTTFLILFLFIGSISLFIEFENHNDRIDHYNLYRKYVPSFLLIFFFYKSTIYFHFDNHHFPKWFYHFIFTVLTLVSAITAFGYELNLINSYQYVSAAFTGEDARQIGFFENPNEAGYTCCFSLAFAFFLFGCSQFKYNLFYILSVGISLFAIAKTFSRAAILGSIILIFLFVLICLRFMAQITTRLRITIIIFCAVISGLLYQGISNQNTLLSNLSNSQKKRIETSIAIFLGDLSSDGSSAKRLNAINEGMQLIRKSPIIGNGIGAFNRMNESKLGVHNTYLLIQGNSGFVPFLAILFFVLYFFYQALLVNHYAYKFLLITVLLINFIVVFLTSHNGIEYRVGTVLSAIAIGILEVQQKINETNI